MRPLIALVLLSSSSLAWAGQELARGAVIDNVACQSGQGQGYALYLPSRYSADRKWPILYAFDSGARGRLPVERFKNAAERLGVIVAGSNNSRNGPMEISRAAASAMLQDTQARFAIDPARVYVTGFSGGARVATGIALVLKGQVAGVIAFGAGFPQGLAPSAPLPFAFFGAAGTDDFNYPELRQLDDTLERIGARHRLEIFAGPHDWPPERVCAHALDWMELAAARSVARDGSAAFLDEMFAQAMVEAAGDESAGRPYEAFQRYAALAKDFAGLRDVSTCEQKARQLDKSREVRQLLADLKDSVDRQAALEARFVQVARESRAGQDGARATLDLSAAIGSLLKQADAPRQSADRMAARRTLVSAWVVLSEAGVGDLARNDFAQAAVCFRAMTMIRPENIGAHYNLACASARCGNRKEAIEALRRAVANGFTDVAQLKTDPDLDSLRSEPAFRLIVEALEKG